MFEIIDYKFKISNSKYSPGNNNFTDIHVRSVKLHIETFVSSILEHQTVADRIF